MKRLADHPDTLEAVAIHLAKANTLSQTYNNKNLSRLPNDQTKMQNGKESKDKKIESHRECHYPKDSGFQKRGSRGEELMNKTASELSGLPDVKHRSNFRGNK